MHRLLPYLSLAILTFTATSSGICKEVAKSPQRGALSPLTTNRVIPHLTHGGNWQSTLILMNVSKDAVSYRIKFFKPNGQEASFKSKHFGSMHEAHGMLQPGGSLRMESIEDDSDEETSYWAELVEGSGRIQATVVFGWQAPGRTPMDVTVPNTEYGSPDAIYFPFDLTAGRNTAAAFVNNANNQNEEYSIEARNESGNQILDGTIRLDARSKRTFILSDEFPDLLHKKGVIIVRSRAKSNVHFAPVVLQFHPAGSITYIPAYDEY